MAETRGLSELQGIINKHRSAIKEAIKALNEAGMSLDAINKDKQISALNQLLIDLQPALNQGPVSSTISNWMGYTATWNKNADKLVQMFSVTKKAVDLKIKIAEAIKNIESIESDIPPQDKTELNALKEKLEDLNKKDILGLIDEANLRNEGDANSVEKQARIDDLLALAETYAKEAEKTREALAEKIKAEEEKIAEQNKLIKELKTPVGELKMPVTKAEVRDLIKLVNDTLKTEYGEKLIEDLKKNPEINDKINNARDAYKDYIRIYIGEDAPDANLEALLDLTDELDPESLNDEIINADAFKGLKELVNDSLKNERKIVDQEAKKRLDTKIKNIYRDIEKNYGKDALDDALKTPEGEEIKAIEKEANSSSEEPLKGFEAKNTDLDDDGEKSLHFRFIQVAEEKACEALLAKIKIWEDKQKGQYGKDALTGDSYKPFDDMKKQLAKGRGDLVDNVVALDKDFDKISDEYSKELAKKAAEITKAKDALKEEINEFEKNVHGKYGEKVLAATAIKESDSARQIKTIKDKLANAENIDEIAKLKTEFEKQKPAYENALRAQKDIFVRPAPSPDDKGLAPLNKKDFDAIYNDMTSEKKYHTKIKYLEDRLHIAPAHAGERKGLDAELPDGTNKYIDSCDKMQNKLARYIVTLRQEIKNENDQQNITALQSHITAAQNLIGKLQMIKEQIHALPPEQTKVAYFGVAAEHADNEEAAKKIIADYFGGIKTVSNVSITSDAKLSTLDRDTSKCMVNIFKDQYTVNNTDVELNSAAITQSKNGEYVTTLHLKPSQDPSQNEIGIFFDNIAPIKGKVSLQDKYFKQSAEIPGLEAIEWASKYIQSHLADGKATQPLKVILTGLPKTAREAVVIYMNYKGIKRHIDSKVGVDISAEEMEKKVQLLSDTMNKKIIGPTPPEKHIGVGKEAEVKLTEATTTISRPGGGRR